MIRIVTDSTSDLTPGFAEKHSIVVVPLHIHLAGRLFLDGIDLTAEEFYAKIRSTNEFPMTSPPLVDDFCRIYQEYDQNDTIFSIHISSKMSQTVQNARQAAETNNADENKAKVYVVDSLNASFGLGIIVTAAQRMIDQKIPPEEIPKKLEKIIQHNQVIFGVPNLDFLKKGGRLGRARSLVGKLLGYKPILGTQDGEIIALDKIKDKKRFPQEIVRLMKSRLKDQNRIYAGVFHVHAQEPMEKLKEHIAESFDCVELLSTTAGPVIGSHTGYGAIAVAYYPDLNLG